MLTALRVSLKKTIFATPLHLIAAEKFGCQAKVTEKPYLSLASSQPTKPRRTYAGEPIECPTCKSRNLTETFSPTFHAGRIRKGKRTGWACPYCQKIVAE